MSVSPEFEHAAEHCVAYAEEFMKEPCHACMSELSMDCEEEAYKIPDSAHTCEIGRKRGAFYMVKTPAGEEVYGPENFKACAAEAKRLSMLVGMMYRVVRI